MKTRAKFSPQEVAQLVAGSREGDPTAFDQLVDLYWDGVRTFVARRLFDAAEAEDVAQEAFIKAYRSLPAFRGDSSFQTWLYRIAGNLAVDSTRRRNRHNHGYSLDAPLELEEESVIRELPAPSYYEPEKNLETTELRRELHGAICDLSPKLREVMVLREQKGLNYVEIAETLGCPLGTVKSRLFCARDQLRRDLAPYGYPQLLPAGFGGLGGPEVALAPSAQAVGV